MTFQVLLWNYALSHPISTESNGIYEELSNLRGEEWNSTQYNQQLKSTRPISKDKYNEPSSSLGNDHMGNPILTLTRNESSIPVKYPLLQYGQLIVFNQPTPVKNTQKTMIKPITKSFNEYYMFDHFDGNRKVLKLTEKQNSTLRESQQNSFLTSPGSFDSSKDQVNENTDNKFTFQNILQVPFSKSVLDDSQRSPLSTDHFALPLIHDEKVSPPYVLNQNILPKETSNNFIKNEPHKSETHQQTKPFDRFEKHYDNIYLTVDPKPPYQPFDQTDNHDEQSKEGISEHESYDKVRPAKMSSPIPLPLKKVITTPSLIDHGPNEPETIHFQPSPKIIKCAVNKPARNSDLEQIESSFTAPGKIENEPSEPFKIITISSPKIQIPEVFDPKYDLIGNNQPFSFHLLDQNVDQKPINVYHDEQTQPLNYLLPPTQFVRPSDAETTTEPGSKAKEILMSDSYEEPFIGGLSSSNKFIKPSDTELITKPVVLGKKTFVLRPSNQKEPLDDSPTSSQLVSAPVANLQTAHERKPENEHDTFLKRLKPVAQIALPAGHYTNHDQVFRTISKQPFHTIKPLRSEITSTTTVEKTTKSRPCETEKFEDAKSFDPIRPSKDYVETTVFELASIRLPEYFPDRVTPIQPVATVPPVQEIDDRRRLRPPTPPAHYQGTVSRPFATSPVQTPLNYFAQQYRRGEKPTDDKSDGQRFKNQSVANQTARGFSNPLRTPLPTANRPEITHYEYEINHGASEVSPTVLRQNNNVYRKKLEQQVDYSNSRFKPAENDDSHRFGHLYRIPFEPPLPAPYRFGYEYLRM